MLHEAVLQRNKLRECGLDETTMKSCIARWEKKKRLIIRDGRNAVSEDLADICPFVRSHYLQQVSAFVPIKFAD